MTTYYWPIVLPIIALGLAAYGIIGALGYRSGKRAGYAEIKDDYKALQVSDGLTLCYADGLEQENERLNDYADQVFALNADMHDQLIEQAERYKTLERQTVEVKAQAIPKRPPRTKKVTQAKDSQ